MGADMASVSPGVTGTWEDIFGPVDPDLQAAAQTVRDLVHAVQPDVVEMVQPGYRAVNFAADRRGCRMPACI